MVLQQNNCYKQHVCKAISNNNMFILEKFVKIILNNWYNCIIKYYFLFLDFHYFSFIKLVFLCYIQCMYYNYILLYQDSYNIQYVCIQISLEIIVNYYINYRFLVFIRSKNLLIVVILINLYHIVSLNNKIQLFIFCIQNKFFFCQT